MTVKETLIYAQQIQYLSSLLEVAARQIEELEKRLNEANTQLKKNGAVVKQED